MTRALLPGRWNRHGRAVPDLQPCELDGDLGPDFYRVIQPPIRTPEDVRAVARARRWALYLIALGFSTLAGLLGIADARWVP